MKTYEIKLKHDAGTITIRTRARNVQEAYKQVCNAENAPESAVKSWRIVPTAAQIRKTQKLLANL